MGEIANDMINGHACSLCGIYFEDAHGYPVLCDDCYDDATPAERQIYIRAVYREASEVVEKTLIKGNVEYVWHKALSIKNPWAWLIVHGIKDIENRNWKYPPRYRGEFLIHVGKQMDMRSYTRILDILKQHYPQEVRERFILEFPRMKTGGIMGKARITDVVSAHSSPWFEGPMGLVLEDQQPLKFYPCKGQLNFFNVKYPVEV